MISFIVFLFIAAVVATAFAAAKSTKRYDEESERLYDATRER